MTESCRIMFWAFPIDMNPSITKRKNGQRDQDDRQHWQVAEYGEQWPKAGHACARRPWTIVEFGKACTFRLRWTCHLAQPQTLLPVSARLSLVYSRPARS